VFDFKVILGVVAVLLTFSAYVPYIKDILKGKTRPHLFSWFLWGFVTLIVFALQVKGNAGVGSLVTLSAAIMCVVVFILGLFKQSTKYITKMDIVFFDFITMFAIYLVGCKTTDYLGDLSNGDRPAWFCSNNKKILE